MMEALEQVLARPPPPPFPSLEAFWSFHHASAWRCERPVDRALLGGWAADRLGYAFAAGYAAALQALFPKLAATQVASLAATEEGGAHPGTIRASLQPDAEGFRLSGHKRWVTLAASELFVLARAGEAVDGRAKLVVVRVERERAGVTVVPQPPPPFVPEIPHAELLFEGVRVAPSEVLPGDGWNDWVKPFRTVEDLHVHAALLGLLLGASARFDWPRPLRAELASAFVAVRALAAEPPSAAATHVALDGLIAHSRSLVEAADALWQRAPPVDAERWSRDRPLLEVAGKARAARAEKAWAALLRAPPG